MWILWMKKETFLDRDTGVAECSTISYTLFYLISIYINSCKDQLSKFQVFWKFCWGSLKSFQHCGQIFIFHWNLFKKRKPLYSWQFFLNAHSFFPPKLSMFFRMTNTTFSSTSVWYRDTWLSVNSCWMLLSFLQI